MKLKNLFFILFILLHGIVRADDNFLNVFKAGSENLQTFVRGYAKPLTNGLAAGLGTSWYNTAATHNVWGFDFMIGASGLWVSSDDRSFSLDNFKYLKSVDGKNAVPTFAGKGDGVELMLVDKQGREITRFTSPSGVSNIIPAVDIQLSVGLPYYNDLSIRLIPTIKTGDVKTNLWGVGLKCNIFKKFKNLRQLPMDAAIMLGYTQINCTYSFTNTIVPADLVENLSEYTQEHPYADYSGQRVILGGSSFMANFIASKDISFLTPYAGLGITKNYFKLGCRGDFPIIENNASSEKVIKTLENPISLHYSNVWPGLTVGLRCRFLHVGVIYTQYTLQKYSTFSIGFGVSFN